MTKTISLIALIGLISFNSFSQDNWKPADSESSWNGRTITWFDIGASFQSFLQYYTPEESFDTLISEKHYTKLFYNISATDNYFNAFRSDTIEKAIYFVPKDSTNEYLFFDFDAPIVIGDTITIPHYPHLTDGILTICDFKLNSIDSMLIDGDYYKIWNFDATTCEGEFTFSGQYLSIMERAISHYGYPFTVTDDFETHLDMRCYSENDTHIYGNTCPYTEDIFNAGASLTENNEEKNQLYPNPVINELYIQSDQSALFTIYDTRGKLLLSNELNSGTSQINVFSLTPGTYIYMVKLESTVKTGLFVKH